MQRKSTQGSSAPSVSSGSFDDYNSRLQGAALRSTRNAASLPADINFYRSLDTGVAHQVDAISSRVLNIANKLIQLSSSVDPKLNKGKGKAKLQDKDDVVDKFHSLVVDVMDQLFERTDSSLDQVLNLNKAPAIAINPPAAPAPHKRKVVMSKSILNPIIHHAAHLAKPQLSFKRRVDNSDAPWYPSLSHKYNAKVPLGHVYTSPEDKDENLALVANHPYRYEINHMSYPSHVYDPASPTPPPSLSETPFTWIATSEAFQGMLDKIRTVNEIAVDLEHQSYRSYFGFLCLMQISTREEDFVVDVIALRDEMEVLNEVFTNPKIVKVFHGAESDIVWLQQDFNIYVVNLFDTFHASKLLDFPRHGLANLLEMYCDYTPDKRYQLADWRIRPLPDEMLEYARSDTHFLLFIYDNLRNALLDRAISRPRSSSPPTTSASASFNSNANSNAQALCTPPSTTNASTNPAHTLINHVLARSAETCLRVYTKDPYDHAYGSGAMGWDTLARKWNKPFFSASGSLTPTTDSGENQVLSMQKAVYRAVHWWRERIAREEDESTRYVLPNQYLFRIAESPPGDLAALLRLFGGQVPAVVKKRAKELLDDVREAVRKGLGKAEESEVVVEKVEAKKVEERPETIGVQKASRDLTRNLWSTEITNQMIRGASSLFENAQDGALTPSPESRIYTSVQSTLFGNGKSATVRPERSAKSTQFQELVTRINSTLVIAPIVPKVTVSSTDATPPPVITSAMEILEDTTGMQIEIPFVPSAQRQITTKVEEKDTIVVVGKPKVKKRKRTKNIVEVEDKDVEGAGEGMSDVANGEDVKDEPFDFTSVPNILDDNPDMEDRKPVKKQKKGQGGQFLGDFPAPPRAHSEFKGGNKSHTFR